MYLMTNSVQQALCWGVVWRQLVRPFHSTPACQILITIQVTGRSLRSTKAPSSSMFPWMMTVPIPSGLTTAPMNGTAFQNTPKHSLTLTRTGAKVRYLGLQHFWRDVTDNHRQGLRSPHRGQRWLLQPQQQWPPRQLRWLVHSRLSILNRTCYERDFKAG